MKKWLDLPACRARVVCLGLFLGTLLLFSRAVRHDFLDYDDPDYVTQNLHVQGGITWASVCWAFSTDAAGNWHPLTWLSHMLDWQLFGNNPHGHHATNLFLHALNAVMAFLALRRLTGAFWMSAVSAALFAWHPLRVESVAWIAERKDLLSGFFGLLSVWAYAVYAEKRREKSSGTRGCYAFALAAFATGLLCKPMLVTLPFVLLLLDFWPLGRFTIHDSRFAIPRLFVEKIPFFFLSATSCFITYLVQKKGGAIVETLAFDSRLANAVVAVTGYLGKFFWPVNLAVTYSLPNHWPVITVAVSALLVLVVTLVVIWQWRVRPWLPVGWFWFLGMLVPVIGLVQAGHQAMADRYTYLPVLGLQTALLGTLRRSNLFSTRRWLGASLILMLLIGCAARTWNQQAVWKNSRTLHEHALAVTEDNYLAHSNLGTTLFNERQPAEAERHFRRAIEINPDFATARFKLGLVLEDLGRADDALAAYAGLLKIRPRDADAHYNSGVILLNRGQPAEALPHFQAAVQSQSNYTPAYVGMALAAEQLGRLQEAIDNYEQALQLNPKFPGLQENLAQARRELAGSRAAGK